MSDTQALAQNAAAAPAAGTKPEKNCKCPRRRVEGLDLKYRTFRGTSDPGHSWYEMGDQSVGWYPSPQSSSAGSFFGTTGAVNHGQARDPHHGDRADTTYDLFTRDGDCRTDEEIKACIRNHYFARQASGGSYGVVSWNVCHSIANAASAQCGVTQQVRR